MIESFDHRHRVVIVGAGFGGLAAAKGLAEAPVDVAIVDANNFHLFQPLLYQVATAGLDADDVAYAVRGIFRRQRNVTVHMATVTAIDLDAKVLTLDRGDGEVDELPYDTLVVAAGAVSTSFGIDGVEEHAIPLKDLDDALDLRLAVLERFERAAIDPASVERGELNVVVSGGGPTGVETAGAMMELFTRVLAKDFPTVDVQAARVVLVEAAPRLLGAMSTQSSDRALRTLSGRGVEVRTGVGVARITSDGSRKLVHLADGTVLPAGVVVWAAGVRANPLAEMLGVELTKGGRIVVDQRPHGRRPTRRVRRRRHRRFARPDRRWNRWHRRYCRRSPRWRFRVADMPPGRSSGGSAGRRPSRSATTTRARWRRSAATTRSPSYPAACGSSGWSAGWPGWDSTCCT